MEVATPIGMVMKTTEVMEISDARMFTMDMATMDVTTTTETMRIAHAMRSNFLEDDQTTDDGIIDYEALVELVTMCCGYLISLA
jgi:hypothetical protein